MPIVTREVGKSSRSQFRSISGDPGHSSLLSDLSGGRIPTKNWNWFESTWKLVSLFRKFLKPCLWTQSLEEFINSFYIHLLSVQIVLGNVYTLENKTGTAPNFRQKTNYLMSKYIIIHQDKCSEGKTLDAKRVK